MQDHTHGHGHAHGHDHGMHDHGAHHAAHGHTHSHVHSHAALPALAEPVGWSLLRASLGERLLLAAGFTGLAWALIGLALS